MAAISLGPTTRGNIPSLFLIEHLRCMYLRKYVSMYVWLHGVLSHWVWPCHFIYSDVISYVSCFFFVLQDNTMAGRLWQRLAVSASGYLAKLWLKVCPNSALFDSIQFEADLE
ncbi:hypothetical protein BJX96DRAFT_143307 [Aspergillus floccosus]